MNTSYKFLTASVWPSIALAIALFSVSNTDARQFYRFKNEEGQTVLLDQLTPQAILVGYQVISSEGKVIQTVPAARTLGELQEEKKRAAEREQQKLRERMQLKKDAELLRLFNSVDDIIRAREAALLGIDQRKAINQTTQDLAINQLKELQAQAANYERLGNKVPRRLQNDIDEAQRLVIQRRNNSVLIENEREMINNRYEKDIVRFKEIEAKRLAFRIKNSENQSSRKGNVLLLTCESRQRCRDMWQLAQIYATNNSTGRLDVITDSIILMSPPKNDTDISLSFSQLPAKDETQIVLEVSCADTDAGQQLCASETIGNVLTGFKKFVEKQMD